MGALLTVVLNVSFIETFLFHSPYDRFSKEQLNVSTDLKDQVLIALLLCARPLVVFSPLPYGSIFSCLSLVVRWRYYNGDMTAVLYVENILLRFENIQDCEV